MTEATNTAAELRETLDQQVALIQACTGLINDLMLLDPEADKYLSVTVAREAMDRADADFSEVNRG